MFPTHPKGNHLTSAMISKVGMLVALTWLIAVLGVGCDGDRASRVEDTGERTTAEGVSMTHNEAGKEPSGGRVPTCGEGTVHLNAKEKKILELHNQARKKRGLKPLCVHPALTTAARAHSKEMIEKDYFSHNSYGGASLAERLKRHGYDTEDYRYWRVAGNIAWGNFSMGTPEHIFGGWMSSSTHRPHILSEEFRQIGVGTYTGKYKGYENATMYTVEFGVRRR